MVRVCLLVVIELVRFAQYSNNAPSPDTALEFYVNEAFLTPCTRLRYDMLSYIHFGASVRIFSWISQHAVLISVQGAFEPAPGMKFKLMSVGAHYKRVRIQQVLFRPQAVAPFTLQIGNV